MVYLVLLGPPLIGEAPLFIFSLVAMRCVSSIPACLSVVVGLLMGAVACGEDLSHAAIENAAALPAEQDEPKECCHPTSRFAALAPAAATPRVSAQRAGAGVRIAVDGEPFAEYLPAAVPQPVVWPIYGPGGARVTREWPLGPLRPHENDDHPHHASLWCAHGGVRLAGEEHWSDFWTVSGESESPERIVHARYERVETLAAGALIETTNDWLNGERRLLTDRRFFLFGADGKGENAFRWIDATIHLTATEGDIEFKDTKEGTFALRVAGTMKRDAGLGGVILNSRGQRNADAWGRSADWVDFSGPVLADGADGAVVQAGVAMLSHPDAFRPLCRWHARGYGLFAANPFGEVDFRPDGPRQGAVTLPAGESLTLRYRVVLHNGRADAEAINRWREAFAATPLDHAAQLAMDRPRAEALGKKNSSAALSESK